MWFERIKGLPWRGPLRVEGLLAAALVVAAGLRLLGRDNDYAAYQAIYQEVFAGQFGHYERLFEWLAYVSGHLLGLPFGGFLLLCAALAVPPKLIAFHRYAANFTLAVAGYVLIYWVLHDMTQIRAGLALGFGALAFGLLQERRWLLAALCYAVSVGFHNSMLALAPFALLPGLWRRNELALPLLVLVSAALSLTLLRNHAQLLETVAPLLAKRLEYFYPTGERLISVRLLLCSVITAIGLANLRDLPTNQRMYVWMCAWGAVLYVVFASDAAFSNRLFELACFFMLFWIGGLKGLPGRVSSGLFMLYAIITSINYYRYGYLAN